MLKDSKLGVVGQDEYSLDLLLKWQQKETNSIVDVGGVNVLRVSARGVKKNVTVRKIELHKDLLLILDYLRREWLNKRQQYKLGLDSLRRVTSFFWATKELARSFINNFEKPRFNRNYLYGIYSRDDILVGFFTVRKSKSVSCMKRKYRKGTRVRNHITIDYFQIFDNWRNLGIGQQAYSLFESQQQTKNVSIIGLSPLDAVSATFWKKCGFRSISRHPQTVIVDFFVKKINASMRKKNY